MNMMKKLFIIAGFLLTILAIRAQAKYCDNDADFVGNKWKEIPNVGIVYKKDGINDYGISFETGNKETDKFLKKSNYYISCGMILCISIPIVQCKTTAVKLVMAMQKQSFSQMTDFSL